MPPPVVCLLDGEWPPARTALQLLAQRDLQVIVGHSDAADDDAVRHLGPCAHTQAYPDPLSPTEPFEDHLLGWLSDERPDVVLPLGLATTLAVSRHAHDLADLGIRTPVPTPGRMALVLDRALLWDQAQRLGLAVPQIAVPTGGEDLASLVKRFAHTPTIVPRLLTSGEAAQTLESPADVPAAHAALGRRSGAPPVLVESIPAEGGWYAVTALCDAPGGVMARLTEVWTGWDVVQRHPRWRAVSDRREAVAQALRLLGEIEWTGPATVQFALDPRDATPKLLQIWPGLGGGIGLAAAADLDLVWPLVEWALGDAPTLARHYRTDIFTAWSPDGVPWTFTPRIEAGRDFRVPPPTGERVKSCE